MSKEEEADPPVVSEREEKEESEPAQEAVEKTTESCKSSPSATAPKKEAPSAPPMGSPAVVLLAVGIAMLAAAMQNEEIAAGTPHKLFEPHVVPPPKASKNEVVIQFCQS
jgi:hypothetical protein